MTMKPPHLDYISKYSFWIYLITTSVILSPILIYPGWLLNDTCYYLWLLKDKSAFFLFNSWSGSSDRLFPIFLPVYQLLSKFTFSPKWYFIYHYISASTIAIAMYIIFEKINLKNKYTLLLIFFIPGFTDSFYHIVNEEKELLFLWVMILLVTVYVQYSHRNRTLTIMLLIMYPLLAIFPIFMKETSVILSVSFSVALLVFNSRSISRKLFEIRNKYQLTRQTKYLLLVNLLGAVLFGAIFLLFTTQNRPDAYLHKMNSAPSFVQHVQQSVKVLLLYIISDPLMVLVLPILFIYSIIQRLKKKSFNFQNEYPQRYPFIDACAIGALSLVSIYILLGFHGYRYLLPAYPFGLIAITAYIQSYSPRIRKYYKNPIIYISMFLVGILLVNSVLSALNVAVFRKVSSYNFMQYKNVLKSTLETIPNTKNINIYFPGNNDMTYIKKRHVDILEFYDIITNNINYEYSSINQNWVKQNQVDSNGPILKMGDLLLITPNSTISMENIMVNLEGLRIKKIIHTTSPNYYELPEIRHLLKYIMLRKNPASLTSKMIYRETDYAIYEVL